MNSSCFENNTGEGNLKSSPYLIPKIKWAIDETPSKWDKKIGCFGCVDPLI